jgi:hypothetical protein
LYQVLLERKCTITIIQRNMIPECKIKIAILINICNSPRKYLSYIAYESV